MARAKKADKIEDEELRSWFETKYIRAAPEHCWIWQGAPNTEGYGQIHYKKRLHSLAHRVSYLLYRGDIPEDGLLVCHTCDVTLCVNPNHLWLGTHDENMQDMVDKKRSRTRSEPLINQAKGEAIATSKLTASDVLTIRERYGRGNITYRELAKEYNVNHISICFIVNRKTWKHI